MAEIITSAAFNERFTIHIDHEGNPIQRTLREMTADEVIAAAKWSTNEAARVDRETKVARVTADQLEEDIREELERVLFAFRAVSEATTRHIRVLTVIRVAMPQWRPHSPLPLLKALCRYWPHGRAA